MSKFVLTAQLQLQAPTNVAQVAKQIQNQLSNVSVNIQAKGAAQTTRQVQNFTKAVQQADSAAFKLGKTFTTSLKRFAAFSVATRAVSLFTQGIGGALDEAIKFERELIKVAQVTGKTVAQLSGLTNEIKKLSTNLGVSSSELLNVSRALSQAGFSARETKVALDALAKSSLAPTFEDMAKTAEGAIAIFNQFGKGAAALEAQLGAINAVAGQFAVEAGDLISVIRRTGGVFKAAGGDLNELIALFTSVRATTRESAESIATGLRTIFTRIQRPRTIKFLEGLGVSLTDLEGKFVGPFEAIKRLSEALGNLEAGDLRFVRIAEELGGFRQIGKVIPLLNQFGVAQEAYNTALGGANSLTKDAETAQQSLAVQLQKLREQWLSTVRSITESTGFKIAVEAAMSLASAVLNIADALKSVLPLLAAFGAFKIAKGMGGFLAGAKAGAGAAVPKFASGGLVPGSGSRDTVPAMLTPGEFVIRKSSVQKMGAKNLQNMNAKGFAKGGPVITLKDNVVGGFFLEPDKGTDRDGSVTSYTPAKKGSVLNNNSAIQALRDIGGIKAPELKTSKVGALGNLTAQQQHAQIPGFTITQGQAKKLKTRSIGTNEKLVNSPSASKNPGQINDTVLEKYAKGNNLTKAQAKKQLQDKIDNLDLKPTEELQELPVTISAAMKGMILGSGDSGVSASVAKTIKKSASDGLRQAISDTMADSVVQGLSGDGPLSVDTAAAKEAIEKNLLATNSDAIASVAGFVQEGLINNITGAPVGGGQTPFDFPNIDEAARTRLELLYGEVAAGVKAADAKPKADSKNYKAIADKFAASLNKQGWERFANKEFIKKVDSSKKFARGGPAPSDTVPAMLTPGEFVISKKAAQSIGPANLDRMNKKGVQGFAKGGPVGRVQKFALGGGAGQGMGMFMALSAVLPAVQAGFEGIAGESQEVEEGFAALKFGMNAGMATFAILFAALAMIKSNFDKVKKGLEGVEKSSDGVTSAEAGLNATAEEATKSVAALNAAADTAANNLKETEAGELEVDASSISVASIDNFNLQNELTIQAQNVVLHGDKVSDMGGADAASANAPVSDPAIEKEIKSKERSTSIRKGKLEKIGTTLTKDESTKIGQSFAREDEIKSKIEEQEARIKPTTGPEGIELVPTAQVEGDAKGNIEVLKAELEAEKDIRRKLREEIKEHNKVIAENEARVEELTAAQAEAAQTTQNAAKTTTGGGGGGGRPPRRAGVSFKGMDNSGAGMMQKADALGRALMKLGATAEQSNKLQGRFANALAGGATNAEALNAALHDVSVDGVPLVVTDLKDLAEAAQGAAQATSDAADGDLTLAPLDDAAVNRNVAGTNPDLLPILDNAPKVLSADEMEVAARQHRVEQLNLDKIRLTSPSAHGAGGVSEGDKERYQEHKKRRKKREKIARRYVEGDDGGRRARVTQMKKTEKEMARRIKASAKGIKRVNKQRKKEEKAIAKLQKKINSSANGIEKESKGIVAAIKGLGKKIRESKFGQSRTGKFLTGGTSFNRLGGMAAGLGGAAVGMMSAVQNYQSQQFDKAVESGDPADLITARGMVEGNVDHELLTSRISDTLAGAAAGAAAGSFFGPIGMAIGGAIGGAGGFFKDEIMSALGIGPSREERLQKKINEKNAMIAETNLDKNILPSLKKSMEKFQSTGSEQQFDSIIKDFDSAREEIKTIAKSDKGRAEEREKQLEGEAKVLAGSIGSTASSQAELNKRILELSKKFPELAEELENTAKTAFILAEANRAQIKLQADILKVSSVFRAASLGVGNFLDSLQTGANTWNATVNTLKEAQQNIALGENAGAAVQEARDRVRDQFKAAGAGDSEAAQAADRQFDLLEQASNFSSSLPTVLKNTTFERGATDEAAKTQIKESLLGAAGVDENSELGAVIAGRVEKLAPEQLAAIRSGDLDLSEVFSDLQGQVAKLGSGALAAAEALQAHENTIIKLTAARIKAEQNLIATQKQAVDLQLEAAQIAAKFGGASVTAEQRRNAAIEKFNLTAGRVGAGALTTGTGADIRSASGNLTGQFAALEMRANRPGGFAGAEGLDADKRSEILRAQGELVNVTKALIEADKQELDIIKKKNALEKESLDKLIGGDTAGFVQGMAANAATSLIASGDASGLSGDVLSQALQNIRKQREAGVTDIDGIDIRTVEQRAAQAALAARGVTDPRAAAMVAGQTREEEEIEARIRERAGALGAIGENMVDMAQMQVQTAQMTIQQANIKFREGLNEASNNIEGGAMALARGGMVYASRGMFVPRGTDTVPAMLTPGEFVVNRASVNRGNNLQILRAINNGNQAAAPAAGSAATMNQGGQVGYYNNGGLAAGGMDASILEGLNAFNTAFAQNISNLQNTRFQIKLDTTNVVVTLNGGSFLNSMKEEVKSELLAEVGNQISNLKFNNAGEAKVSNKVLDQ